MAQKLIVLERAREVNGEMDHLLSSAMLDDMVATASGDTIVSSLNTVVSTTTTTTTVSPNYSLDGCHLSSDAALQLVGEGCMCYLDTQSDFGTDDDTSKIVFESRW
jgi:hypothetical protein